MDEIEVLEELGEEVSGLQKELRSTESEEDSRTVREKQKEAEELVEEIQDQLEFLNKLAEEDRNR